MIFHGFVALFHLKAARGREEESLLKGIAITFIPLVILYPIDLVFLREYSFKIGYVVFSMFTVQIYLYISRHYFHEFEPDPGTLGQASSFEKELLSSREEQVVQLLIQGKTNTEIADMLYISVNTIKSHVKNIYRKLGINNRMQLLHLIKSSHSM